MGFADAIKKLEFDRILEKIKGKISSEIGESVLNEVKFYTDETELEEEINKVLEVQELIYFDGFIDLSVLKDIKPYLQKIKIERSYLSADKFLYILSFLHVSRQIKSYFKPKKNKSKFSEYLFEKSKEIFSDKLLEYNIERVVDDSGNIKDSASKELKKIREEIREKSNIIRKVLFRIMKDVSEQDLTRDEIVTLRDGRLVIPVKIENKRKVSGIIHSTSGSGVTVFIEPSQTIELNNEISELQYQEQKEIEKILFELSKVISSHSNELIINYDIIAEYDFLQAKARYGMEINGVKPQITKKKINFANAYHPLLLGKLTKEKVVPLNLEIGNVYNTVVVSGPNAGGKTVTLKTIGLLQLMLQFGLLIPAGYDTEMRLFKKIFVIIGDEQSIENDLSTFSSHIKSISQIYNNADSESLILIDEICSGTDPKFGSALSSSLLKEFTDRKCISIVTTHIGDLKNFAYSTEGVENASLEFDTKTLSPNYKLNTGIPGRSFTLEIANKYGLPDCVIKESENRLKKEETNLEDLIKELIQNKQKYEKYSREANLESVRLKGLSNDYDKKLKNIKSSEREIIKKSKDEAKKILSEANKLVEKTIKEIRENKDILVPKEIKSKFSQSAKILLGNDEEEITEIKNEFKIGDLVRLKSSNAVGEITDLNRENAMVNVNGVNLRTNISELEIVDSVKSEKTFSKPNVGINTGEINDSLDIRGLYTDQVSNELEKFINNALIYNLNIISIIHGKGTGKLREEVRKYLAKSKYVRSFRYGSWNEGDSGVTIVELKK
jgi:DNA mismatch repair protein MutS2